MKKGSLMVRTLKKFSTALRAAKSLHIFSRGAAWPLHFKFAFYAYVNLLTAAE